MEPVSTLMGIFMLLGAHLSGNGGMRYSMNCWGMLSWHKCWEQNYSDIHTPAYFHALRVGHNPHRRTVKGVIYVIK